MNSLRALLASAVTLGLVSAALPAAAIPPAGVGLRLGVASATIRGDHVDPVAVGTRTGFAEAMFARIRLSRWFSIQPELGWASKGNEGDIAVEVTTTSGPILRETWNIHFETRLDYVEIPALLRLDVPTGSFFEPYVLAGPEVAIRTGSSRDFGVQTVPTPSANTGVQMANIFEEVGTFDHPEFENFDWSLIAGGGLTLGRGSLRVVLDSRYALGMAGIYPGIDRSWGHNEAWITTLGIELR